MLSMVEGIERGSKQGTTNRADAIACAKKSLWPVIAPYALMGMTAAEIGLAVRFRENQELPRVRIETLLSHARHQEIGRRQLLPELAPEKKRQHRIDALRRSPDQLEQRVRSWLETGDRLGLKDWSLVRDVRDILSKHTLLDVPKTVSDWLLLSAFLHARRQMQVGDMEPLKKFSVDPDTAKRLNDCLVVVRKAANNLEVHPS